MTERKRNASEEWAGRMGVPPVSAVEFKGYLESLTLEEFRRVAIPIPDSVHNERGWEVLRARYGAPNGLVRTQETVGQILGMSRWAVGRLERRTINDYRAWRESLPR